MLTRLPLALYIVSPVSLAVVTDAEDVIVVSAESHNQQKMTSTSLSITKEMMARQGDITLADVLQNTPGIQLRYGGHGVPQLDIRGYKSRHITFLVNGVPQSSAWNSQFDPQLIPVQQIERVDIVKGASGSLLYGAGGFGGVINVITRRPDIDNLAGEFAIGAGNGEHYNVSGNILGVSGDLDYAASYAFDKRNGFPLSDDFVSTDWQGRGLRNNSDSRSHALSTSLNWQLSEFTRLGLNMNVRDDKWGVPDKLSTGGGNSGNLSRAGNGSGGGNGNSSATIKQRIDPLKHSDIQATFDYQRSPQNTLRGYSWYSREDRHTKYPGDIATDNQSARTDSYGTHLQWISSVDRHTLTNGINFTQDNWRCSGDCGQDNHRHTIQQQEWAAEYQYQPDETRGIAPGGALYHNDAADSVDYAGQLSGYWLPLRDTRLFASAARRIRYPDLRQLYEAEYGNSSLKPEESYYYEAGIEQIFSPYVQMNLSVYSSDIYHYIEKSTTRSDVERYENFDHYRFQGIETSLRYFMTDDTDLTVGYSWLQARNKGKDTSKSALQGRPEHSAIIALNTALAREMAVSLRIEGFWDSVQYQGKTQTPVKLDNYQLVGFSLLGPLPWQPFSWQFTVNNLFDKNYEQAVNLPRPGREWLFQIKAHFLRKY